MPVNIIYTTLGLWSRFLPKMLKIAQLSDFNLRFLLLPISSDFRDICFFATFSGESTDTVEAVDALKRSPQGSKSLNTTLY